MFSQFMVQRRFVEMEDLLEVLKTVSKDRVQQRFVETEVLVVVFKTSRRGAARVDPAPQERMQRHTVEHRIEACPFVQILDAPVPQAGDQLVEAFRHLDLPIPEQVVEVPKISSSSRRSGWCRVPLVQQTAEQLVEVPTIVSVASLRALVEQNVDIPVLHGRGCRAGRGGLQGLRRGQVSTASSSHSPGAADFTPSMPAAHVDTDSGGSRLLAGGTYWPVTVLCAGTLQGDGVAGCGFLVLGSFCPLCNDRCRSRVQVERESLIMRQSTVAFQRISCISCSRCSHLEIWRIISS